MAEFGRAIVVNKQRCKGYNLCVVTYPTTSISLHPDEMNDKGYHYCYMNSPETCVGCANCGVVRPGGCISVYKVAL